MTTPTVREAAVDVSGTRRVFAMTRHTVVAPAFNNDGEFAPYTSNLRQALMLNGIDGWTEYASVGYWRGRRESGTVFELYRKGDDAELLARLARAAMPDQEAVQVTVDAQPVRLVEA